MCNAKVCSCFVGNRLNAGMGYTAYYGRYTVFLST